MKCTICKNGETIEGRTIVTLDRDNSIIVFKNVPAEICENCGHYYLGKEIAGQILKQANESIKKGAEFEIIKLKEAS